MRLTLALCAALTLTACADDPAPDRAACKAAMVKQYEETDRANPGTTRPDECDGITNAELEKIVGEILTERLGF